MSTAPDTDAWEGWLACVEDVERCAITDVDTIDRLYALYLSDIEPDVAMMVLRRWPSRRPHAGRRPISNPIHLVMRDITPPIASPRWRKRAAANRDARVFLGLIAVVSMLLFIGALLLGAVLGSA